MRQHLSNWITGGKGGQVLAVSNGEGEESIESHLGVQQTGTDLSCAQSSYPVDS